MPSVAVRGASGGHQAYLKSERGNDTWSPRLTGKLAAGRLMDMSDAIVSKKISKVNTTLDSFNSKTNNRKKKKSTKK